MSKLDHDALKAVAGRLRYRYPAGALRNPDGPEVADAIDALLSELAAAKARVERLRAGLQPFATAAARMEASYPSYALGDETVDSVKLGDLRLARTTLGETA